MNAPQREYLWIVPMQLLAKAIAESNAIRMAFGWGRPRR